MVAVQRLEKDVASNTVQGAFNVQDWRPHDSKLHDIVGESGNDILCCSFAAKDGSSLLCENFSVYGFSV